MFVTAIKVSPGRLDQALQLAARCGEFVEQHGAIDTRTYTITAGGSSSGLYAGVWQFEDLHGYAKVMDAFAAEPEGQAIAMAIAAADPPGRVLFEAVYNEVVV